MLNEIGNILLEAECEAILLQFHVSYTPRKRNLEADALSIPSYPWEALLLEAYESRLTQ